MNGGRKIVKKLKNRNAYMEPLWHRRETKKLADEWLKSDTEEDIMDYILAHASDEFIAEHERAQKILKGEIDPDDEND